MRRKQTKKNNKTNRSPPQHSKLSWINFCNSLLLQLKGVDIILYLSLGAGDRFNNLGLEIGVRPPNSIRIGSRSTVFVSFLF